MKTSIEQIESRLRRSQPPTPPAHLRQKLLEQYHQRSAAGSKPVPWVASASWVRRWWPAVACGALATVSLVVLGLQQWEVARLRDLIESLQPATPPSHVTPTVDASVDSLTGTEGTNAARTELERLRSRALQLSSEIAGLEKLKEQNRSLHSALTGATPAQIAQLAEARDRAKSIMCINNLKQLGLAARVWATDHKDTMPPDLSTMRNEIVSPKITACPADESRMPAASWEEFSPANVSYEFLAPAEEWMEPNRVVFRCPAHGHVGLMDGSVHQIGPANQAQLHSQNGKTYLDTAPPPPTATNPSDQTDPGTPEPAKQLDSTAQGLSVDSAPTDRAKFYNMDPQLAKRYGLYIETQSGKPTNAVSASPAP